MIIVNRLEDVPPGVEGPDNKPETKFLIQADGKDAELLISVADELGKNPELNRELFDQLNSEVRRQPNLVTSYLMARGAVNLRHAVH